MFLEFLRSRNLNPSPRQLELQMLRQCTDNLFFIAVGPGDHSIRPGLMHVIWAVGQKANSYSHSPQSALEAMQNVARPNFYAKDVLLYHGYGPQQRGTMSLDFYEKPNQQMCGEGQYSSGSYLAKWRRDGTMVSFNIEATIGTNMWTGIGFSQQGRMV